MLASPMIPLCYGSWCQDGWPSLQKRDKAKIKQARKIFIKPSLKADHKDHASTLSNKGDFTDLQKLRL
jgi:hypothetical protein